MTQKLMLQVLAGQPTPKPPVWFMRQAGRYLPEYRATRAQTKGFLDLCYRPELAAEVTLQPLRRFPFDAAILFADILVVPDALGQGVRFLEGEGPQLDAITGREGLARLKPERIRTHLAPIGETLTRLRQDLPKDVTLIGFAGAPWTVATYMAEGHGSDDQRAARLWAYRDPEGFQELIDLLVVATTDYLAFQIEQGAEVVQLFDSWAAMMPEAAFRRWVITPTRRIVTALKARHPQVPVIGFPRGAGLHLTAYAAETGCDGVSLDTGVPAAPARAAVPAPVALQGNLDPLMLIAGGGPLDRAVDHLVETLGPTPYIFNLGHGIVPETPPEHVLQAVRRVRGL